MDWEILRWIVNAVVLHRVTVNVSKAFLLGLVLFFIIYCLERYYGATTRQYRSRHFFHDAVYWLWTGGGLNRLVLTSVILSFMTAKLSVLKMDPLQGLPTVPRYLVYWIVVDLLAYAIHRWRHASRFMWAFHTTHHAQEKLSFATVLRIHPVEFAITDLVMFVPLLVLGAPPQSWLSLYYLRVFMEAIQHSQLPWRFGPLYYVFVSPMFHACHHSVSPEHHDRNFGVTLSVWDFLFGTAVTAEQRPARYGLEAVTMPTLVSSLVAPFHVLRQTYWSGTDRQTAEAGKVAAS